MLHAAIDTSAGVALAVARNSALVLSASHPQWGRQSDRDLVPWLQQHLEQVGVRLADVQSWSVGTGPGSFVGLRVGIALVKGICRASGAAYRGIPSSRALASAIAAGVADGALILALHDARRHQVIGTRYRKTLAGLRPEGEPEVLEVATAVNACAQAAAIVTVHATELQALFPSYVWDRVQALETVPAAEFLHEPDWPGDEQQRHQSCEPIYVRPAVFVAPQALRSLTA